MICYVTTEQLRAIDHPCEKDSCGDIRNFPEFSMTFNDMVSYIPHHIPILTGNPWLISCYDRQAVRVLKNGKWVMPEIQTYGASVNKITMSVLGRYDTMGDFPKKKLKAYNDKIGKDDRYTIDDMCRTFGESVERTILINNKLDEENKS